MPPPTVAVVLAAGGGSRFLEKGHKLLATLPSDAGEPAETVAGRAIRRAVEAGVGPVVVVTGAVPLELPEGVTERHNPAWAEGQATSVQAGL